MICPSLFFREAKYVLGCQFFGRQLLHCLCVFLGGRGEYGLYLLQITIKIVIYFSL